MIDTTPTISRTRTRTTSIDLDAVTRDVGVLAVRATAGLILAGHGAQKLFGWWGGPGFDFTVNGLAHAGYTPARVWAQNGGYELPLLFGIAALTVAFTGPGRLSLDRHWRWANGGALSGLVALGLGVTGALIVMAVKAT